MSIQPTDAVRAPSDMAPPDKDGVEGKWLDVPRLQQLNGEARSGYWCGRTSAAMIYDYYCKAAGKTSEYIGHDDGDAGTGPNAIKKNLRWLGGSHKGKFAGLTDGGMCWPAGVFSTVGWKIDSGELVSKLAGIDNTSNAVVEKIFARHLEQLRKNNPIVQFTQLTKHKGHIVVISGYKKDDRGRLWLRITDPCYPHLDLMGPGNVVSITSPSKPDKEFSEYWLLGSRLLAIYPGRETRLFSHAESPLGHFFYVIPDTPVKDDSELVHRIGDLTAATGDDKPKPAPAPASSGSGGSTKKPPPKPAPEPDPADKLPAAACPPATATTRLPFEINGSDVVTASTITSLYHQTERALGGFFPLGDNDLFHCGAHLTPDSGKSIHAIADGEVVAARIGVGPGEHEWGDTGFVILRHPTKDKKNVYSLFLHLRKEALHPDRTSAPWLRRLLIDATKAKEEKDKWRVTTQVPTWKDADKGKFGPANVQNDQLLDPGVYEEDEELTIDAKRYVKLKGKWVKADDRVKELSPYANWTLEDAIKKSPVVKLLSEGKVAVLDKDKDGDKRKHTVQNGEPVGVAGSYLGSSTVHWSMFSKDSVFPEGALGEEEFKENEKAKVKSLDLSGKQHGSKEHAQALIEALDPKKKVLGNKKEETVIEPGELRHFYRTPTQCWRSRYQAVKGLADFKLDVDKLMGQDRYKSHTEKEKKDFAKLAKDFLFWDELKDAEDFPTDGNAIWVHPVTGLRLMSNVVVPRDTDDPPGFDATADDRVHPEEDVILVVRDDKGPLAAVDVTVKADGAEVFKGKTDSQGELVVAMELVAGKQIEISVDESVVGKDGQVAAVLNETGAASGLMPGDPHQGQTTNGTDGVPESRLGMMMKMLETVQVYQDFDAHKFELAKPVSRKLPKDGTAEVERFVWRRADGQFEAAQVVLDGKPFYFWSIEKGKKNADPIPDADVGKKAFVSASWSSKIAHVDDHPVLSGRVQNISDGTELQVDWYAILAQGAPEHDVKLMTEKCKVALGGFAEDFDPHWLSHDNDLLNTPKPVYAKIKAGKDEFSLRSQVVTCYAGAKVEEKPPKPPQHQDDTPGGEIIAFTQIDREGHTDKLTTWSKDVATLRKVEQLSDVLKNILVPDGADMIYVGPTACEQHLATDAELHMSPADAIEHQKATTRAIYGDVPDWVYGKGAGVWNQNNGISTGICAVDCRHGVNERGQKNGCTTAIWESNLAGCQNAHYGPCQTGIDMGPPVTVKSCGAVLGACGSAHHDKSHCFFAAPVEGPNAEERERWYCALPMRTQGDGYAYKHAGRDPNLHVLLINPKNGAMVVCSQEDRGPGAKSSGNDAVPEASVQKNEFLTKGRVVGPSFETAWKLGLPRTGGDPIVLVAFVPSSVPLGPVAPGTRVKLREKATYDQIMGLAPVPAKGAAK